MSSELQRQTTTQSPLPMTQLAKDVVSEVTQYFGDKVCRNKIPRTVKLAEAPSFGQPISVHAPGSRGAVAYKELAREVSGVS